MKLSHKKKRFFLQFFASALFVLSLISMPLVSSAVIETKSEFDRGETLIATVHGTFIDTLTRDNVRFMRGYEFIPREIYVEEIEGNFYIFTSLERFSEGNYSMNIEGIEYILAGQETDKAITKNFTITNKTADFNIFPGIISTKEKGFSMEIKNLQNKRLNVDIDSFPGIISEPSIDLAPNEIRILTFHVNNEYTNDSLFGYLNLSSENTHHDVPVFLEILPEPKIEENDEIVEAIETFSFDPPFANISMNTSENTEILIYLVNQGIEISNISLEIHPAISPYVNIERPFIENFRANISEPIRVNISSPEEEKFVEGKILAVSEDYDSSFLLSLNFTREYYEVDDENKLCSELGGNICLEGKYCPEEPLESLERAICCPVECKPIDEPLSTGQIIGWTLIVLVIFALVWFFIKYKKVKPSIDILKRGKSKK